MSHVPVSLACLLLVSTQSLAELVPAYDLHRLVNQADLIVVGSLEGLADLGPASIAGSVEPSGRLMSGRIVVRQVLKGSAAETLVLTSPVWRGEAGRMHSIEAVFLLNSRGESVEFASPYYPLVQTVAGRRIRAADPLEGVIEAIALVFQEPTLSASVKWRAIDRLVGRTPLPAAIPHLRAALQDSDRDVGLAALTALLANNDGESLPVAEAILLSSRPLTPAESNLRYALRGLKDSVSVPGLMRLLARSDVGTRREAALALGQMRSNAAIRALGRALDDDDFEVRFNAAQALADAVGNVNLRTTPEHFRDNEATANAEWKERLAAMGIELP